MFGKSGYLHAQNGSTLRKRMKDVYEAVPTTPPTYQDNLVYLADVLRGKIQSDNDLSSLNNNMIVVKILEAARQSAKEGKRIVLKH